MTSFCALSYLRYRLYNTNNLQKCNKKSPSRGVISKF